tara:strand:- start:377 stop:1048 length:672 start_codon:yes stop_codon:yes gene_type:complete
MKLITFSLWGQDLKYLVGALRNAELAKTIYPDWICRFYVGQSVPTSIIFQLEQMDNVQVIHMPDYGDWTGMFWRFVGIDDDDVEVMISRDTDSRLNHREKAAVDQWMLSNKTFHIMRDHPAHGFPILGGMWGIKNTAGINMRSLVDNFKQQDLYGTDYKFLSENVMPKIKNNSLIHDEFFDGQPFPTKREGLQFVGQVFDHLENTVEQHQLTLKNYLNNKTLK